MLHAPYLIITNHEIENERSPILLCTQKMTNKRGQDTNNVPNRHIWIMREFLKKLRELYWGTNIIMSATVALSDHELVEQSAFCISFINISYMTKCWKMYLRTLKLTGVSFLRQKIP